MATDTPVAKVMIKRDLYRDFRWAIKSKLYPLKWRWNLRRAHSVLLARHACLGEDVLKLLRPRSAMINVQKGRVDYLTDCWEKSSRRANTALVFPHMERNDTIPCILQEEMLFDWMNPKHPTALFMDSMAEHGDQRFFHKNDKWSFLCAHGDLRHSVAFKQTFESAGLLPLDNLTEHFGKFFEQFRVRFGNLPIFYLHFPVKLDKRQKFLERYWAIREAVDSLAREFKALHSLAVDDAVVDWDEERTPDMWDFPYHYNRRTYESFSDLVRKTGCWIP